MKRPSLADLANKVHQLLVVGGGIIGCGIAREAALRGIRVALVESEDFGSGTTSRSTRLIHGGLRYLEQHDFGLVRQDLQEREVLLRIAPHLVRPLPFLVPMYRLSAYQRTRLRAGMVLYDALSFDKSLPAHRILDRDATLALEPNLDPDGLQGAARYFDAQVELPERLCIENALDAALHGAIIRNYTASIGWLVEGGCIAGTEVEDRLTGERATIRARWVINATGPWLDTTLEGVRPPSAPRLLRTTRGVHLVTPSLGANAVVLFSRRDRRLFFVVPWRGMSLIGTTDSDEPGPPREVRADREDVRYLLEETRRAFPRLADLKPHYCMAGVRALVRQEGVHASEVSRAHALRDHRTEGGPAGLISVLGGKITGYRAIAEDAVNLLVRSARLGQVGPSITARRPLPGAAIDGPALERELAMLASPRRLEGDQLQHLAALYGRRAPEVLKLAGVEPGLAERVVPDQPTTLAEVALAAREESAMTLADVLLRRTPLGLGPDQGRGAASRVAEVLGRELGWGEAEREAQAAQYRELLERRYGLADAMDDAAAV